MPTLLREAVEPCLEARTVEPVRLGVVGLNFGEGMARHIAREVPRLRLVALCDQNTEKAEALGREFELPTCDSLDGLLEDPRVEAVAVFTGPRGRAQIIRRILRSGRHVLTTKPFETDVREAARVLDEARDLGLAVHVNSPTPTASQDVAQIQRWIHDHDLGRPVCMQAQTWANYREQPNGSWYDDPELCPVAPLLRLGIYFLNDFVPLMGRPERVHVQQSRLFTGRPTVDHAQVGIEYAGGATASLLASFCVGDGRPYQDEVVFCFERGTIRRWMVRKDGRDMGGDHAVAELQTPEGTLLHQTQPGQYAGWYQWNVFADAVRGVTRAPLCNRQGILFGLEVLEAIARSGRSGLPETVSIPA